MEKGKNEKAYVKLDLEANYGTTSGEYDGTESKSPGVTPEENASWLSMLTFSWFTKIMDKAYNSNLEYNDFFDLPEYDTPSFKLPDFTKYWERELKRCNVVSVNERKEKHQNDLESTRLVDSSEAGQARKVTSDRKPSLIYTLILTFKWELFVIFCLVVLADTCLLAQSIVLRKLLLCMQNPSTAFAGGSSSLTYLFRNLGFNTGEINLEILQRGLYLVFLMTFLTILFPMLKQQEYRLVTNLGRYSKCLVSGVLYRKLLLMDSFEFNMSSQNKKQLNGSSNPRSKNVQASDNPGTVHNFVNLMGNDVFKLSRLISAHLFYSGTFLLVALTFCLYSQLGVSALFGISVVIANMLISVTALHFRALERKPYLVYQDQRIRYTSECLSFMKIIKSYAWEECFTERITNCRNNEIKSLFKQGKYRALSMGIYSTTMQATLVTSLVYVLMGNKLDPATVFFAEGLFETLSSVLSCFPFSYSSFHDIIMACNRIRDFLVISEQKRVDKVNKSIPGFQRSKIVEIQDKEIRRCIDNMKGYVKFQNVRLHWPDGNLMLKNVSFEVKSGEIVAIIGSIGSGKTGLLSAIIGEISPCSGQVIKKGKLAYVAQIPWVQTGSIRDNILFGTKMDPEWYDAVIKACALWMDFQILPDGDQTLIGEKGVNLSGGQRQRISLARAVYQKSDVYVLDDCLSAVDSHVAAHIFNNCICGLLGEKCVILVTHKLDIIPNVDRVILFDAEKKKQLYVGNPLGLSRLPSFTLQNISFESLHSAEEEDSFETDIEGGKPFYGQVFGNLDKPQPRSLPLRGFPSSLATDSDRDNEITNTHNVYNRPIITPKDCSPLGQDDSETGKIVDDVVAVDLLDELVTKTENSAPSTPRIQNQTPIKSITASYKLGKGSHKSKKKTGIKGGSSENTLEKGKYSKVEVTSSGQTIALNDANVSPYLRTNKVGFIKGRTASIRMSGEKLRFHYRKESDSHFSECSMDFLQNNSNDRLVSGGRLFNNKKRTGMIQEESIELGSVSKKTYYDYFSEWGLLNMLGILFCHVISGFIFSRNMFWLANWTGRKKHSDFSLIQTSASSSSSSSIWETDVFVYILLIIFYILSHMTSTLLVRNGGINASRAFHEKLLNRLRYTKLSFFESTPIGRILNRFTGDLTNLDDSLPRNIGDLLVATAKVIVITISISKVVPKFLICIPVLAYLFLQVSKKYAPMLRQSERLAAIYAAPILSHTVDTIDGLTTIRAFNAQERFIKKMDEAIRVEAQIRYHAGTAYRWLFVRLEIMGCIAVFTAGTLGVISVAYDPTTAGMFGAAMTFALSVSSCLNFGTRVLGEIEGVMVGLERIRDYTVSTPLEAMPILENNRPPRSWPSQGRIEFDNLELRYKPEMPLVLNCISCNINPGDKVGVVGRTGAGKSSIFISILRLVEAEKGCIKIDDIDIFSIGTFDLRSRISIIPQDPIIFSGTIKFNLDPLQQYTDKEIHQALKGSHLDSYVSNLPLGLYTVLESGGQILSAGQKQLLCLARALLRQSKVVLLDEATSSVDSHTDSLIQKTIRTEFHNSTILAVAHRVQTVLDYDKIMVLDSGKIVEFDHPNLLLSNPKSIFYSLVHGDQQDSSN
ncbi:ABC transporter family [Cryptosporidium sp. chipmunk genotype I]|uniref:ABC transporter family n=1 Tax=Cryptosporidium sp. chipmunk genotype I TaxID=1280935 RepID=UPI00351A4810|nr:ABC transporter family [Cryptosporidium sp. chipmunk genotype I]